MLFRGVSAGEQWRDAAEHGRRTHTTPAAVGGRCPSLNSPVSTHFDYTAVHYSQRCTYTFNPSLFAVSIMFRVPRLFPSHTAIRASAISAIFLFRIDPAAFPWASHCAGTGFTGHSPSHTRCAAESIPRAAPWMISVMSADHPDA